MPGIAITNKCLNPDCNHRGDEHWHTKKRQGWSIGACQVAGCNCTAFTYQQPPKPLAEMDAVDKDLRIEALEASLGALIEAIDGSHETVDVAKARALIVLRDRA